MAQKLEQDLNIIQNSGIEIQLDPLTSDLDIIQKLDDEPNDVGGLSAQQLKAKFDEAGNIIKTFINDSLIPQVLGDGLTEQTRQENEQLRQANEQTRQENEAARVAAEAAREAAAAQLNQALTKSVNQLEENIETAEAARNVWENYDPQKNYVPGNKVYYLGSSYVNKVACTDVLPTVEANWQMIAKKGADSDEGMSQDAADLRYLQLTGGTMTGALKVQTPTEDANPATKGYTDNLTKETLNTAKSYTNTKSTETLNTAKSYTDTKSTAAQNASKGYSRMVIFQESGTFSPSSYGLNVGDIINIIAVGGGGGGANGASPGGVGGGSGGGSYAGDGGIGYGAGGGGGTGSSNANAGGGGGSGYVVRKTIRLSSLSNIAVTVGARGNSSAAGGTSSFGNHVTAEGGKNGVSTTGGSGGANGGYGGKYSSGTRFTTGGKNGAPGNDGHSLYTIYTGAGTTVPPAGGGGGGGFTIPFSALTETIIGEKINGKGVVVVYW